MGAIALRKLTATAIVCGLVTACAPDAPSQARRSASNDHEELHACAGHAPFGGALQHSEHAPASDGDVDVAPLADVRVGADGRVLDYDPWIATRAGWLLRNPAAGACLSSSYGPRATRNGRVHAGIDLAAAGGGPIVAAAAGRIDDVRRTDGYGLHVIVDHGGGVKTLYAHLRSTQMGVRTGRRVRQGQVIGRMGRSGNATGVHLHYEVRVDGRATDPLAADAT